MKTMISILFALGLACTACTKIPIPASSQIQAATAIGCAVVKESGCYSELADALPGLAPDTCTEAMSSILNAAQAVQKLYGEKGTDATINDLLQTVPAEYMNPDKWDPSQVDIQKIARLRNGSCAKLTKALGVK